jgi:hypothetical protein
MKIYPETVMRSVWRRLTKGRKRSEAEYAVLTLPDKENESVRGENAWFKPLMRRTDKPKEPVETPFHSWLLRRRVYCEWCSDRLEPGVAVIKNTAGHDVVVCKFHANLPVE